MNSPLDHAVGSRRHFLATSAMSVSSLAFAWFQQQEALAAEQSKPATEPQVFDTTPKVPPAPPQAKAMISLWMQGGPSHHDLFDPKPEMAKYDGQAFPGELKQDNAAQASSKVFASPWKFTPSGQCGMELSELLPHTQKVADDICLIRSMKTGVNNHGQSIRALQSGRISAGRPTLGSWLTYALGSAADNLPAFVALIDPGQLPVLGVENWSNGWLPSIYQGTVVRPTEPRILDLTPPTHLKGKTQTQAIEFLQKLNAKHLEQFSDVSDLQARMASYELAAKMQMAATDALDLSQETEATKKMYGIDQKETAEYGSRCLIARRLVERGVRFVQVYTANQLWDSHGSIISRLPAACQKVDKPSAALVADLRQRGLLDSTVVHWGGEMGRLPVVQNDAGRAKAGRDHNTHGFSMWVAGGGFRSGYVHGKTDEWGHKAVEGVVNHFDYHATLLHLLGLDHQTMSFRRGEREQTLTDGQPAQIIRELLA
ncbi:DUF1501 domain-containing protein [Blastopirellula sp. J2-11]|uniref:DUF1501 domain-containing protein n=1 Tax=Blastopirellula sp. J2-11 TaxID=2943192 RepID=UPI0021C5BF5C|nr:DUF1501 domain-containing protein [Blastopirellula sp. J2-11]UUO04688.1 DUF1501 domain-containing protein [Blastopirellula sp. J2-11]